MFPASCALTGSVSGAAKLHSAVQTLMTTLHGDAFMVGDGKRIDKVPWLLLVLRHHFRGRLKRIRVCAALLR